MNDVVSLCRRCQREPSSVECLGRPWCLSCMIDAIEDADAALEAIVDSWDGCSLSEGETGAAMREIAQTARADIRSLR